MPQQVKYCPHRRVIGQSCAMCRDDEARWAAEDRAAELTYAQRMRRIKASGKWPWGQQWELPEDVPEDAGDDSSDRYPTDR